MTHKTRRTVLQSIGGIGIALGTGAVGSAAAAGNGRRQGASAPDTIFDIVEESDDFDVLELALEEAGLDTVLDGSGQYTAFAPTDEAFGELSSLPSGDALVNVLLYHVTEGRRYASSIVNPAPVEMLNGDSVETDGAVLNGGQAEIVETDIEARNGVVHVIDGVLLP